MAVFYQQINYVRTSRTGDKFENRCKLLPLSDQVLVLPVRLHRREVEQVNEGFGTCVGIFLVVRRSYTPPAYSRYVPGQVIEIKNESLTRDLLTTAK